MLDADTKRRIDNARDVLVGKVPDPKSQVEQITIALIYKFMDDIDAQSEEWGGKRKFFAGDFARYGWARLLHHGLGGHEILNLYAEAIDRMPQNPGIPPLFRDIFENAYLPYRDPQTLRSFLEIIDEFSYDHSERLGDAFEYLLSVLGSQGDAGQFRTPRHIIDFIVAVIDPKKDESLLDPACGTAGFLISSYKHVLANNADDHGNSTLTPDEKARLAANVKGYDISPDMVRLSLVNMYLHDFVDPHIFEYDTLTSEDRWHEYADVILANPPFMSPKGGIRPHNRFSVKSKRSEVLFVDYMAEHLTSSGRAGIIVPEGIIFQSQNAYKQLRKTLVEEYLVAVVSLPAGVFQPYSGVKTSILLLDRSLAKRTNYVGFFKVENDGFDLGAQRRPLEQNDLPQVSTEITAYLRLLGMGKSLDDFQPVLGLIVEKEKISANDDYNLSGERYREVVALKSSYPLVPVGNFFRKKIESLDPRLSPEDNFELWSIPAFDIGNPDILKGAEIGSQKKVIYSGDVLLSRIVPHIRRAWVVQKSPNKYRQIASTEWIVFSNNEIVPDFLKRIVVSDVFHQQFMQTITGVGGSLSRANPKAVSDIQIPLPPLQVQKEIVAEIEGYQKVIDGARAVVDNYRPHIPINPEWPMVEVKNIFLRSSVTVLPDSLTGPLTYIGLENIASDTGQLVGSISVEDTVRIKSTKNVFYNGDILYGRLRPNLNKVWFADRQGICSTDILVIRPSGGNVLSAFYAYIMRSKSFNTIVLRQVTGAQLPRITWRQFENLQVPLPPQKVRQQIVADIEAEQALVAANKELIERFEEKIQKTIARVWGEENNVLVET